MKIKQVEIEWVDSMQENKVWWWIDEYLKNELSTKEVMKSVGYLIGQDKMWYVLATSLHFDRDGKLEKAGTIFRIPKGCVIKIKS